MKTTASQFKIIRENVSATYHTHQFCFCKMTQITYRLHLRKLGTTSPSHFSLPKMKTFMIYFFFPNAH